jgi:hypothetical protein
MLDNELRHIWQSSNKKELIKFNKSELLTDLDSKLESFDKSLKNRDRREIIASIIIILFFGTAIFFIPQTLSRIALLIIVLYGILVIYILKNVRKYRVNNYFLPIKEYLIKHRQYLIKERSLLDNVLYWYILPPTVSAILFFIGRNIEGTRLVINILVVFIINLFIYFLNKRAVKKDFDPLIKKLDITIKNLEASE